MLHAMKKGHAVLIYSLCCTQVASKRTGNGVSAKDKLSVNASTPQRAILEVSLT